MLDSDNLSNIDESAYHAYKAASDESVDREEPTTTKRL